MSKSLIGAIALVIVSVAVCGCLGSGGSDNDTDEARYDYELEVRGNLTYENPPGYTQTIDADEGYHFIVATIKVINNSTTDVSTNSYMWDLTANSVVYESSSWTYFGDLVDYQTVDLQKGGTATFQIIYEVPLSVSSGTISYSTFPMPTMAWDDSLL